MEYTTDAKIINRYLKTLKNWLRHFPKCSSLSRYHSLFKRSYLPLKNLGLLLNVCYVQDWFFLLFPQLSFIWPASAPVAYGFPVGLQQLLFTFWLFFILTPLVVSAFSLLLDSKLCEGKDPICLILSFSLSMQHCFWSRASAECLSAHCMNTWMNIWLLPSFPRLTSVCLF